MTSDIHKILRKPKINNVQLLSSVIMHKTWYFGYQTIRRLFLYRLGIESFKLLIFIHHNNTIIIQVNESQPEMKYVLK